MCVIFTISFMNKILEFSFLHINLSFIYLSLIEVLIVATHIFTNTFLRCA
jgi:hypothetical protein